MPWNKIGNIKGTQGEAGLVGPQGAKGETGAKGDTGPAPSQETIDTSVTNAFSTATSSGSVAVTSAVKSATADRGYAVATFSNNFVEGMKLSIHYSPDGKYVVNGINNPVYSPAGGVRDPSLYKARNGRYYIAYTVNDGIEKNVGLIVSDDFVNWTLVTKIDVSGATGLVKAWAPEIIEDTNGDVYIFFTNNNETTTNQLTTWRIKATNANLTTWTTPTKVVWASGPIAPPGLIIDTTMIYALGQWRIFFGGAGGQIWMATSPTLTGTFTIVKSGDWAGWIANAESPQTAYEAPEIVEDRPGVYRIYMDRYVGPSGGALVFPGYAWSETTDFVTWTKPVSVAKSPDFPMDATIRHGAWFKIPSSIDQSRIIAATMSGTPVKYAAFRGAGGHGGGVFNATIYPATDTFRNTFAQPDGLSRIKILQDGVYAVDLLLSTSPGANMGGGWLAIKSPDEIVNYMTNDFPNGVPAWGISASNIFLRRGTVLKFFGITGAAFPNVGALNMDIRMTKLQ